MRHSRTISYLKADWHPGQHRTLQGVLEILRQTIPNLADTVGELGQGEARVKNWEKREDFLFLHIAAWTRGQKAAVVSHSNSALSVVGAGEDRDFATRSGMMMVRDNHCLFISGFNMSAASMKRYLYNLIERAIRQGGSGLSQSDASFYILPVENKSVSDALFTQGNIRHLELDIMRDTWGHEKGTGLISRIGSVLGAFRRDADEEELEQLAQMNTKLIVSPGRGSYQRKYEYITDIAKEVIDDGDGECMSFVAADGSKISPSGLVLRKKVRVQAEGNSVRHTEAWNALYVYFKELHEGGLLAT